MDLKLLTRARRGTARLIILTCFMVSGCVVNRPPEYESPAVVAVCASANGETLEVSYKEQTIQVTVQRVPSWDALYDVCGDAGGACVNTFTKVIYMVDDRRCERYASHELGHLFGVPGLDIPQRHRRF